MELNLGNLSLTRTRERIFKPLDPTRRQIRLLRTLPPATQNTHPRDPACNLHIESLDSDLQFDAISYCWGRGKKRKKIYIDGQAFKVTENVYDILRMFRSASGTSGYFWIDSICINQQDKAEKSLQVPMMDQIFSRAEMVHVWLGPAVRNVERFLVAADEIESEVGALEDSAVAQLHPPDIDPLVLQKVRRVVSMLTNTDGTIMQPLVDIISSPWWFRLWVSIVPSRKASSGC